MQYLVNALNKNDVQDSRQKIRTLLILSVATQAVSYTSTMDGE